MARMKVLGLTGGMGMGKSTVATLLQKAGLPVFDADAEVRRQQSVPGPVLDGIQAMVPGAVCSGVLDRGVLRQAVMEQAGLLPRLEALIHPHVRRARARFLAFWRARGARWVVLDIPLLFETGMQRQCDHVLVISAPRWVQARRVAARRGIHRRKPVPLWRGRRPMPAGARCGYGAAHGPLHEGNPASGAPLCQDVARMKRSVLFDTETTGLDPATGDRVIEIAALELVGDLPTGRAFHVLLDPQRDVPEEASRVHGFTIDDLRGKPLFADKAAEFLEFIGEDPLIAHNARFDFGFLNAELKRAGRQPLDMARMWIRWTWRGRAFPACPTA